MKIAIVGSRGYMPLRDVKLFVRSLPIDCTIVTGGAIGVDWTAEQEGRMLGIDLELHRPDYTKHGKQAPLIRNIAIAESCDEMRAFWDGESRGTQHALRAALRIGRPAWVLRPHGIWSHFE